MNWYKKSQRTPEESEKLDNELIQELIAQHEKEWTPINSSFIHEVSYDEISKVLKIRLKSNWKIYAFPNISKEEYQNFLNSQSKGSYFNQLRNRKAVTANRDRVITYQDSLTWLDVGHDKNSKEVEIWYMTEDGEITSKKSTDPSFDTHSNSLHMPVNVLANGRFNPQTKECSLRIISSDEQVYVAWVKKLLKEKFGNDIKVIWFSRATQRNANQHLNWYKTASPFFGVYDQDYASQHDYKPQQDWTEDKRRTVMRKTFVDCAKEITQKHMHEFKGIFKRFNMFFSKHNEGTIGLYVNGTYSEPVIIIDLDQHEELYKNYKDCYARRNLAIRTIMHELWHAVQEADYNADDERYGPKEEEEAEQFAERFSSGENFNLKKYSLAKEDSRPMILYHVSPESITRFSPNSKFFGYKGVYLSQSYRSLITDWAPYIKGKKNKTHPLYEEALRLRRLHEQEKDEIKKEEIIEKLHKVYDSIRDSNLDEVSYETLYVYTVECPKAVYREALQIYNDAYEKSNVDNNAYFGFWAWGEQIFIPNHLLNNLKIIKRKELSTGDYVKEYDQLMKKRQYYNPKNKKEPLRSTSTKHNDFSLIKKANSNMDKFCRGYCAEFAIVLHRITGWPIKVFNEPDMDIEEDFEYSIFVHAVCQAPDGRYADARGLRTESEIAKNLLNTNAMPLEKYKIESIPESELYARLEISEDLFEEAEEHIRKNYKLYKV